MVAVTEFLIFIFIQTTFDINLIVSHRVEICTKLEQQYVELALPLIRFRFGMFSISDALLEFYNLQLREKVIHHHREKMIDLTTAYQSLKAIVIKQNYHAYMI